MNTKEISQRKKDHLALAHASQHPTYNPSLLSVGLTYEPCLSEFPKKDFSLPQKIDEKTIKHPVWISSMTGGSSQSGKINKILAKMVKHFELGMGLGSCRVIMEKPSTFKDFNLKALIGHAPFWANLGICELDEYLQQKKWQSFKNILNDLQVDGLIIHINPTQEFLQKKGSVLKRPSLQILQDLLSLDPHLPLIIKEVGQGMGPQSLKALSQMKLKGIEFASLGGTNFASLELSRGQQQNNLQFPLNALTKLGHSAKEMVDFWVNLQAEQKKRKPLWHVIISGGRGHNVIEDVALFKKMSIKNDCSIGLGFSVLNQAYKSEKNLQLWMESYLKSFYYIYHFTSLI